MSDPKKFTLHKDGDDLVVTIPQAILDELDIKIGDSLDVSIEDGKVILTPPDKS